MFKCLIFFIRQFKLDECEGSLFICWLVINATELFGEITWRQYENVKIQNASNVISRMKLSMTSSYPRNNSTAHTNQHKTSIVQEYSLKVPERYEKCL